MPEKPWWATLIELLTDWECHYATDNELRFNKQSTRVRGKYARAF